MLIEFCENQRKLVTNSCFNHPAMHITTWSQQRTNPTIGITNTIYNQIDYIIIDQKHRHTITNARSYAGTETASDHRLVITNMNVKWATLYKNSKAIKGNPKFNIKKLVQDNEAQNQYKQKIQQAIQTETTTTNLPQQAANRWERTKEIIKKAAEESVGYIRNPPKNQLPDELLQEWSMQQKESRLQIEKSKDSTKILSLKAERKAILKQKKRKKELREKEIDEILKEVDSTKDDNKMFKAIKALHCKKKKVQFVNDEKGKSVSNPQEIYKVIEKHFKSQFHKQNQEPIPKFTTSAKKLRKEITADEVKKAVSKMSNNKARGQDEIVIEMFKYGLTNGINT